MSSTSSSTTASRSSASSARSRRPHLPIRQFQGMEANHVKRFGTLGFWGTLDARLEHFGLFLLPVPAVFLAFLFLLVAWDRWMLLALGTVALTAAALASATWYEPHYAAPVLPLVVALWAMGLRRMAGMRRWRRWIGRVAA